MSMGRGRGCETSLVPSGEIVGQDLTMVERQGLRKLVSRESSSFRRIIRPRRRTLGATNENDGNGVPSWIPCGIRVDVKLANEVHRKRGFLERLASGGLLHGLARIDETSRKGPPGRRVSSPDQHQPIAGKLDDDVHGQSWF